MCQSMGLDGHCCQKVWIEGTQLQETVDLKIIGIYSVPFFSESHQYCARVESVTSLPYESAKSVSHAQIHTLVG